MYEKALPHIPYVVQSCAIPVSNISSQSRYHVSVRTKTEEKLIEAYKNSELLCCVSLLLGVFWEGWLCGQVVVRKSGWEGEKLSW